MVGQWLCTVRQELISKIFICRPKVFFVLVYMGFFPSMTSVVGTCTSRHKNLHANMYAYSTQSTTFVYTVQYTCIHLKGHCVCVTIILHVCHYQDC